MFVADAVGWISLSGTAGDSTPYGVALSEEDGACGAADSVATLQPPTADLCATGVASAVTTANGAHGWSCAGIAGGDDAQCSAPGGGGGGGGSVTFVATDGGCAVESVSIVDPPAGGPAGRTMPYGAVAFSLSGCTGDSATVRLTFSDSIAGWEYWKYIDGAWTRVTQGVTLAGNTATLVIADNGPYDANPTRGAIDDPSGPVAPRGGPAPIPALSLWGLIANVVLLGLLGAWRQRRPRR